MRNFKILNPTVEITTETEHININGLWNDSTLMCRFPKDENIEVLENITLPEEFSALIDNSNNCIEFIYGLLNKEDEIINRKFKFNYNNETFELTYDSSSIALKTLAKAFRQIEDISETRFRNLRPFKDYFRDDKTPGMEKFFKDRVPISFYIKGDLGKIENLVEFSKNLNFYMRFYHRRSPAIRIFNENQEKKEFNEYCYSRENGFPEHINSIQIEPVLLDLFQIASETPNIRMKYIFYYQVLEYCSYYHLNQDLKRKLNNVVKNPDIINNSSHYSKILVDEFKNYFKANDDRQKLEKLVYDYGSYSDIENEIVTNADYFSNDIEFEGGFKISALIKNENEAKDPHRDILKSIVDRVDKIRNVLVHIRESRENKVILPTKKNNHLLIPYLFLVRRIAEIIAVKYD
jgi:hypothetical protein